MRFNGKFYNQEVLAALAKGHHTEVVDISDIHDAGKSAIQSAVNVAYRFEGKLHLLMGNIDAFKIKAYMITKHSLKKAEAQAVAERAEIVKELTPQAPPQREYLQARHQRAPGRY